jgi:hypothetical protein
MGKERHGKAMMKLDRRIIKNLEMVEDSIRLKDNESWNAEPRKRPLITDRATPDKVKGILRVFECRDPEEYLHFKR